MNQRFTINKRACQHVLSKLLALMTAFVLLAADAPYEQPLTDEDKSNITYLFTTLSDKSLISLMFYKKSLQEVGNKTGHIHPLKYMGYMYSDPTLRKAIPKINRVAWKRFVKDFSNSLDSASKNGELTDAVIADFTKVVGMPGEKIEPLIKKQEWKELFETLNSSLHN